MKTKILFLLGFLMLIGTTFGCNSNGNNDFTDDVINNFIAGNNERVLFNICKVDTNRIKYRYATAPVKNDTCILSGLYDGCPWFALYKRITNKNYTKIDEWKDTEKLPKVLHIYKGYNEYDTLYLNVVAPRELLYNYNSALFTSLGGLYKVKNIQLRTANIRISLILKDGVTKFKNYGQPALISSQWRGDSSFEKYEKYILFGKWSNAKGNTFKVFSESGDSLSTLYDDTYYYPSPYYLEGALKNNQFINPKEAIIIETDNYFSAMRIDFSVPPEAQKHFVWVSKIEDLEIPKNTKVKYTVKKNNNLWDYTIKIITYEGKEQTVNYRLDIDSGKFEKL